VASSTESDFEAHADRALRALEQHLADVDDLEVELHMGILTIEFADGAKFVTNSHRAAKQIWLAAGSSAWHFDHTERGWIATREGRELGEVLAEALSRKVGRPFELPVPP
jgi:CyaY protein